MERFVDAMILIFVFTNIASFTYAQAGKRRGPSTSAKISEFVPDWEVQLISDLLRDYSAGAEKNEPEQLAIAYAWSYRTWQDPRLAWNITQYNGTRRLVLDRRTIWVPDIEISNSAKVTETDESQVMIYSDGRIRMYLNFQIEFICDMDLKYFPYDTQECDIELSSWHYTNQYLNLTASTYTSTSRIQSAKDFNIQNFTVKRDVYSPRYLKPYGFITITYTVSLSRASGAYSAKLVLPSVLTGFLILATFLLPSSSHEKITLSAILFLCLLVLMVFYHMAVPSTGETILGQYLAFALCINFFATIMAVVSYNIKLNCGSPAPRQFDHMLMHNGDGVGEEAESAVKEQASTRRRLAWLRYVDLIGFVVFSLVFVVGLAVILGRR